MRVGQPDYRIARPPRRELRAKEILLEKKKDMGSTFHIEPPSGATGLTLCGLPTRSMVRGYDNDAVVCNACEEALTKLVELADQSVSMQRARKRQPWKAEIGHIEAWLKRSKCSDFCYITCVREGPAIWRCSAINFNPKLGLVHEVKDLNYHAAVQRLYEDFMHASGEGIRFLRSVIRWVSFAPKEHKAAAEAVLKRYKEVIFGTARAKTMEKEREETKLRMNALSRAWRLAQTPAYEDGPVQFISTEEEKKRADARAKRRQKLAQQVDSSLTVPDLEAIARLQHGQVKSVPTSKPKDEEEWPLPIRFITTR